MFDFIIYNDSQQTEYFRSQSTKDSKNDMKL